MELVKFYKKKMDSYLQNIQNGGKGKYNIYMTNTGAAAAGQEILKSNTDQEQLIETYLEHEISRNFLDIKFVRQVYRDGAVNICFRDINNDIQIIPRGLDSTRLCKWANGSRIQKKLDELYVDVNDNSVYDDSVKDGELLEQFVVYVRMSDYTGKFTCLAMYDNDHRSPLIRGVYIVIGRTDGIKGETVALRILYYYRNIKEKINIDYDTKLKEFHGARNDEKIQSIEPKLKKVDIDELFKGNSISLQ